MSTTKKPGTFRWQDDPNYQGPRKLGPDPEPPRLIAAPVQGPSVLDYAIAARGMRDSNREPRRGKGSAFVADAIGSAAGALDSDVGNQIQSRAAGLRMRGDKSQAQSALDEYTQAFNATDDQALRQQYATSAANIAKGADLKVPAAVEGGSTLAGTLAEGVSKSVPLLAGLALTRLKDGGEVVGMTDEEAHTAYSKAFDEMCRCATGPVAAADRKRKPVPSQ